MEQRADIHDIRVSVARLGDRLIKPVPQLLPLLRGVDILVVLQVVADDEIGTPLFMTPAADFLAGADRFDLDPVREQDDRRLPDLAL